jgi:hypothetical protein
MPWGHLSQNGPMRQLGCNRVSTLSQDAQLRLDALVAAGVQKRDVFADAASASHPVPYQLQVLREQKLLTKAYVWLGTGEAE